MEGLKGLTAQDRANWEKEYSAEIQGATPEQVDRYFRNIKFKEKFGGRDDYSTLINLSPEQRDSLYNSEYDKELARKEAILNQGKEALEKAIMDESMLEVQSDMTRQDIPDFKYEPTEEEQEIYKQRSKAYDEAMMKYSKEYANSAYDRLHASKNIKEVAEAVSPYYRKYKNSDYLPYSNEDWLNIATQYNSHKDASGEESANLWLQTKIQDDASHNQAWYEKLWNGFTGIGASTASGIVGTLGMIEGTWDYLAGNHEDVEGLSGFENFMDSVIDNDLTRLGSDIAEYNSVWNLEEAKKSGLPEGEVIQTSAQQAGESSLLDQIFNVNTIPIALQSGGYTTASMLTGWGEAKLAQGLFWMGRKGVSLAGNINKTTKAINLTNKALNGLKHAENFTNRYVIPGITGTTEGVIEGLSTKKDVLESAQKEIADAQAEYVDKRFNEIMEMNPDLNPNVAYQLAWDEYAPKYEEALKQADFAASRAGINNFLLNSVINGAINSTLKASLQADRVQDALGKSKLFRWAQAKPKYNVTGTGENITVTPRLTTKGKIWNIAKEPLGEFTEEYLQTVSDEASKGGAEHNIHSFIENKYNGDNSAQVGDYMSGDFFAALQSMGESMVSNDAIKSGVYGALSSALGTFGGGVSNYTKRVKGADGKYHTKLDLSRREGESTLGYVTRLMPWRSGVSNAIRENKAMEKALYDDAQTLQAWLRDPKNMSKFDGLSGTFGWAKKMQEAANKGNEFDYRNNQLGKTINDAIMLEKLKGTQYYDAFLQEVIQTANAEEGSKEAQRIIASLRNNTTVDTEGKSDKDILEMAKSNANKLLTTMDKIQEESKNIDNTLGNVDEDVKQSLVFGKLSIDDWDNRYKTLTEEINEVSKLISDNSALKGNATEKQLAIMSRFGSINNAKKVLEKLKSYKESLEKDIKTLKSRKDNLTKTEKNILKEKKVRLNTLKKQLKELRPLDSIEGDIVLNEQEIMNLPEEERAIMLNKANLKNYSEEQQDVITNLLDKGTLKDINFANKIQDIAKMKNASKAFLTQYNEILKSPGAFTNFINRVKTDAAIDLMNKKYDALNDIKDYNEFVKSFEKELYSSNPVQRAILLSRVANNEMFKKYNSDINKIEGIMTQLDKDSNLSKLDAKDRSLVEGITTFLTRNGIDITDYNKAVEMLLSKDETGQSNLTKFINEYNEYAPDNMKVSLDNISTVVEAYKKALSKYKKNEEVKQEVEKQPEEKPISNPAPKKESNIFSNGAASEDINKGFEESEEESTKGGSETPSTEKSKDKEDKEVDDDRGVMSQIEQEIIVKIDDAFHNNLFVGSTVHNLFSSIAKANSSLFDDDVKSEAERVINSLAGNNYTDPKDLFTDIQKEISKLKIKSTEGGDFNERTASLLSQILQKNTASTAQEEKKIEKKETNNTTNPKVADNTTETSLTMKLASIGSNYSGVAGRLFSSWNVEEFLRDGNLTRPQSKVYFFVSNSITNTISESMKGGKHTYTDEVFMPIIAVVENENGPLTIRGKKYQPIGMLQNSNADPNARKIRKLAMDNKIDNDFISSGNSLITTTVNVVSPKTDLSKDSKGDHNIMDLVFDKIKRKYGRSSDKALEEIKNNTDTGKGIIDAVLNDIIRRLSIGKDERGIRSLIYNLPTLKGDGSVSQHYVLTNAIKEAEGINEAIASNDVNDILNFNSRTKLFAYLIKKLADNNLSELAVDPETNSFIDIESNAKKAIDNINSILSKAFYNSSSYSFNIKPKVTDGKIALDLYLGDEVLGTITNDAQTGDIFNEDIATILKNLIKPNGEFRQNLNWQIDKGDDALEHPNRIKDLLKDNILRLGISSLDREIEGVLLDTPKAIREKKAEVTNNPTVTNQDNASSASKPVTTQQGQQVDPDTGLTTDGKLPKKNPVSTPRAGQEEGNKEQESNTPITLDNFDDNIHITTTSNGMQSFNNMKDWSKKIGDMRHINTGWYEYNGLTCYIQQSKEGRAGDSTTIWFKNKPTEQQKKNVEEWIAKSNKIDKQEFINAYNKVPQQSSNSKVEKDFTILDRALEAFFNQLDDTLKRNPQSVKANKVNMKQLEEDLKNLDFKESDSSSKIEQVVEEVFHKNGAGFYFNNWSSIYNTSLKGIFLGIRDDYIEKTKEIESKTTQQSSTLQDQQTTVKTETTTEKPLRSRRSRQSRQNLKGDDNKRAAIANNAKTDKSNVSAKPIIGIAFSDLTKEQQDALRLKYKFTPSVEIYFNGLTPDMREHEIKCLK